MQGQEQLTLSSFEVERSLPAIDAPVPRAVSTASILRSWEESAEVYLSHLRTEGTAGTEWLRRIRWHLRRTPGLLRRAGFDDPLSPTQLAPEHVQAIRLRLGWERNTLLVYFAALRPFLRFLHLPLAESKGVWRLPSGESTHRRWLNQEQLSKLLRASRGDERLIVALEGYNGLRRVEILRLRTRDVDLEKGVLRVCGKGRGGGKWRTIPLSRIAQRELARRVEAPSATDHLLPRSASWVDVRLSRAAERAGLPTKVSNHDLRRTFGRLAYHSGMGLVDLKNVLGHQSVDMTTHYIGLDEDHMREGLARFDSKMAGSRGPGEVSVRVP